MIEPSLISRDSLRGRKIALSVSRSADLARLGLDEQHCRLVIAEVGRAIMLAGGTVVYGGHFEPGGYTEILIEEALRFGGKGLALEITLAESVYRKLSLEKLKEVERTLGVAGKLTLVSESGKPVGIGQARTDIWSQDVSKSLTAMRTYAASETTARLIVGGSLSDYSGAEPGVVEEARLTIQHGGTLLVAGGYGGAAAAIAQRIYPQFFVGWIPRGYPAHAQDEGVIAALAAMHKAYIDFSVGTTMFDTALLHLLAVSHRPADIAGVTVRLLSALKN